MHIYLRFVIFGLCCLGNACSHLPTAKKDAFPDREWLEVPYPPPVAKVERIPPRPDRVARWADGQWAWRGRYVWLSGGWFHPARKVRLVPWALRRESSGRLMFSPAYWRNGAHAWAYQPKLPEHASPGPADRTPKTHEAPADARGHLSDTGKEPDIDKTL